MAKTPAAPAERARKLAETTRIAALLAMVLVAIAALREHVVAPLETFLGAAEGRVGVLDTLRGIGPDLVYVMPAAMLIGALWDLRTALEPYERGVLFASESGRAVRQAGAWAIAAVAAKVLIAPSLSSLNAGEFQGLVLQYESFDLGMAAFAAFILALGWVLDAASEIKAESDQII